MTGKCLLIILDGCRPDALAQAHTPNIDSLWQSGAYTWTARTVMPSITLPTHNSMFRSVPPGKHGVGANNQHNPMAFAFPSILDVARQVGKHTAMFYSWEELRDLAAPGSLNLSYCRRAVWGQDNDTPVTRVAVDYLVSEQPDFAVLYMGDVDIAGHLYGWMSAEYLATIEANDRAVGLVLASLAAARLRDTYTILVQADHGGHGKDHGTDSPEDMTIPWILNGVGVQRGYAIPDPVHICDTAATIAHVLSIPRPDVWEGKPVYAAFVDRT